MGLERIGRLSTFDRSMSRSANTLSALNSCPAPGSREKTMLVLNLRVSLSMVTSGSLGGGGVPVFCGMARARA